MASMYLAASNCKACPIELFQLKSTLSRTFVPKSFLPVRLCVLTDTLVTEYCGFRMIKMQPASLCATVDFSRPKGIPLCFQNRNIWHLDSLQSLSYIIMSLTLIRYTGNFKLGWRYIGPYKPLLATGRTEFMLSSTYYLRSHTLCKCKEVYLV